MRPERSSERVELINVAEHTLTRNEGYLGSYYCSTTCQSGHSSILCWTVWAGNIHTSIINQIQKALSVGLPYRWWAVIITDWQWDVPNTANIQLLLSSAYWIRICRTKFSACVWHIHTAAPSIREPGDNFCWQLRALYLSMADCVNVVLYCS